MLRQSLFELLRRPEFFWSPKIPKAQRDMLVTLPPTRDCKPFLLSVSVQISSEDEAFRQSRPRRHRQHTHIPPASFAL